MEHCLFCGSRLGADLDACWHCGAIREREDEKRVGAPCPRCHDVRLVQFALGQVALQACPRCRGSFLPATEWDDLLEAYTDEAAGLPSDPVVPEPARNLESPTSHASPYRASSAPPDLEEHPKPNLDAPVSCPACAAPMDRIEFGGVSNVIVDVCKRHGIWLDSGELALVVEKSRNNPWGSPTPGNEDSREYALHKAVADGVPREPSLAELLARRFASITKKVVRTIRP